jgi:hypothetical protein
LILGSSTSGHEHQKLGSRKVEALYGPEKDPCPKPWEGDEAVGKIQYMLPRNPHEFFALEIELLKKLAHQELGYSPTKVARWTIGFHNFFKECSRLFKQYEPKFSATMATTNLAPNFVVAFTALSMFVFSMIQTAILHDSSSLLATRFAREWELRVTSDIRAPTSSDFHKKLVVLGYQCPKCSTLGATATCCSVCDILPSQPSTTNSSSTTKEPQEKQWTAKRTLAYDAYKVANPTATFKAWLASDTAISTKWQKMPAYESQSKPKGINKVSSAQVTEYLMSHQSSIGFPLNSYNSTN